MPVEYQIPFRPAGVTASMFTDEVIRLIAGATLGAVIYGPTGTGKTSLILIARRAYSGRSLFVDWPEYAGTDCEAYKALVAKRFTDTDKFNPTPFVLGFRGAIFVDDLGAKRESGYKIVDEEGKVDEFINRRTGVERPLWITTNLTPAEIRSRYGDRVHSRLVEHCLWIPLDGDDRRLA